MNTRELGKAAWLILLAVLLLLFLFEEGCATARPHLWDLCRSSCAAKGGDAAVVIGKVEEEKPASLCRQPEEPRGGI